MRQVLAVLMSGGRLRPIALASIFASLALALPSSVQSQDKSSGRSEPGSRQTDLAKEAAKQEAARLEAARQLEQRREKLTEAERPAQTLQADVSDNRQEQASINERLLEVGRLVQQTEGQMTQIEGRLADLDLQERSIRDSLGRQHGSIVKLFAAMQRMGRNPPPVIVTRREDALEMVRSAMLLARTFPELKSQADELSGQLSELVKVTSAIRSDGDRLKSESSKLNEARRELAVRMENKRQSLTERQRELEDVRRAAADIAKSVTDLSELIGRLDKAVAENTSLGAYNREQAQIAAAQALLPPIIAPAPAPAVKAAPSPPPVVAALPVRPPVVETGPDGNTKLALAGPKPKSPFIALEPRGTQTINHARMTPAIPFHLAKGQLPLPAFGRKLITFGEKTQFGSTSKGIVLETRAGATVTSPCDGWVVYAGEFRSYGQVLIINAGAGYHVLLANLSRIDVEVGRFVLASEPVGTMSSNSKGKGQDSAPVLYVEFRNKEGQSIDPEPWWAEGSQKVQG